MKKGVRFMEKCIEANGVSVITDSDQFCELLDGHKEPFTKEEMSEFFYLFWPNIVMICGDKENSNKQLMDSLNNYAKVSVNEEYKVFDKKVLPHVIEKMNFDFEIDKSISEDKPISEELFGISVIDVYNAIETENNKDIPAYLQFILIFLSLCKSKALTKKVVLDQLLSKCNFLFTDEIIENFISCCGDKVFQRSSLKTFFNKFDDRCVLSKELWKQLMQRSADNAFDNKIFGKFFIDIEKIKIGIDLIEEVLRCAAEDSFNEKILIYFLNKCKANSLSLNAMKNLIKCCPNEIFINRFSEILPVYEKKFFGKEILNVILNKYDNEIKLDLNVIKKLIKIFSNKIFKNSFSEILEKCSAKIFDREFANKILEIENIISSEEIALKFLKCCDEKIFNGKCFTAFFDKYKFDFNKNIFLELIRISSNKFMQNKFRDIFNKFKKENLDEDILKAVLDKFGNSEISKYLLSDLINYFPNEIIQNNLINILEKCNQKVLDDYILDQLFDKKSSNEEIFNLVLEKGDMSSNLPNLLFKKFDEKLLRNRLLGIFENCSDNSLSVKNCNQILGYFEEDEIPNEVANELVRCVDIIDWIFLNLDKFKDKNLNEEFLKAILEKFKSQSREITYLGFDYLLEYFSDEIIKDNLIDILQNLEKEKNEVSEDEEYKCYLSKDVLDKVLNLYQLQEKMPEELSNFLFENFAEDFRFDKSTINKFLDACAEDFHFDESTTEKIYKYFEKQSINNDILVKLLNKGFQFDLKVCKDDNFIIFEPDIFISKNYKKLRKNLTDKSAVKNLAALYNSYNKSNIKIGYGIAIGIGLLILLIAVGLSIATFGLGALAISPVAAIAAIAVTATVGLVVTSVFSFLMHLLRLNPAKIIKNFIEQKYQKDNSIDIEKEMKEKIEPDMRFWLGKITNETEEPLLTESEDQISEDQIIDVD